MLTLKRQLFIVLLLTLMIPAAGVQFVLNLESALRDQQAEQLLARAESLGNNLRNHRALTHLPARDDPRPILFAQPLRQPLFLDGYGDDWPGADGRNGRPPMHDAGDGILWNAAADRRHLYLLIQVNREDSIRYFEPQAPDQPHEKLVLYTRSSGQNQIHHIRTSAPGPISAAPPDQPQRSNNDIQGIWQESGDSYTLELRLPRPPGLTHMGFNIHTPNEDEGYRVRGITGPLPHGLPPLHTADYGLTAELSAFVQPGLTVRVLDSQGWELAAARGTTATVTEDIWDDGPLTIIQRLAFNALRALLSWRQPEAMPLEVTAFQLQSPLLRQALTEKQPQLALTEGEGRGATSLTALTPMTGPAGGQSLLMLEQSTDAIVSLSSTTLGQVLSRSLLLVMALALVLLGYAGWLSWRISRLRRAVAATVDDQGRLVGTLHPGRRRDELDDLAHHFAHLLHRLQGYTRYLETFARKLSHELKTPLAIVHSSLDNLRHSDLDKGQLTYLDRAGQGADRLRTILNAMSEASRLERSIEQAELEDFDLADVMQQATAAYQDLDPDHDIRFIGPQKACTFHGAPDLLVQMLDKLVDNARDFTPQGGMITLALTADPRAYHLSVCNQGSQLPAEAEDLFDSFVSLREESAGGGHLGQGLLIVRLIAELHRGKVTASNQADGKGVCFRVTLPRQPGGGIQ